MVHVPKTAGTSLFGALARFYGPHRCCEHVEALLLPQPSPAVLSHLQDFQVLSGHVPVDYVAYFAHAGFKPLTAVRDPADQFFSHIAHILAEESLSPFLQGIRDKAAVSVGHLLKHATDDELAFFESPQSKPIFGAGFEWRSARLDDRVAWLRRTYLAVVATETMDRDLAWLMDLPDDAASAPFPRLNVRRYGRDDLTSSQQGMLDDLLREDRALHRALALLPAV